MWLRGYADGFVGGRMLRIVVLGIAFAILAGTAQASAAISRSRLERGLENQMQRVGGGSGAWVYDLDAPSDGQLFSWASKTPRVMASNSKLFTTGAALHRFGADGTLETRLYPQPRSALHRHAIRGDLVLVGAGDPALGGQGFARRNNLPVTPLGSLAKKVRKAGIQRVTGKILADDSIFDRRRGVPTSGVDAGGELAPLSGLSYDSGFVHGHYAKSPELVAARALRAKLRAYGVRVKGGTGRGNASRRALGRKPLAKARSPRMRTLIKATNRPSNNFYAEMLLKRLAAGSGSKGTTRRGANKAERFARRLGADMRMENGSGLSRDNRASPKAVGHYLRSMERRADHVVFRKSLPLAAREGTLDHRMEGTAAEGNCRAKTGTLNFVSALSGYCRAGHGLVAFSFLLNSVDVGVAKQAEDKMASLISRYKR
jgi:D-alanyl-D-alanine carboxypeptidase/D-alanyl-D-alanine-endopeptidase (penicillin-binding protein 4)